jgi:hypothetical protein
LKGSLHRVTKAKVPRNGSVPLGRPQWHEDLAWTPEELPYGRRADEVGKKMPSHLAIHPNRFPAEKEN